MQLNLLDKKSKVDVSDAVFAQKFNEPLVHQVVTAYLAGARQGSVAQKTRSEVSGGGKKPWRQKGTGRARAGSSRSPLWRGGGVTFASKPRSYKQKVNKKMYTGAIRSMLSELVRHERLSVVETFALKEAKTKLLAAELNKLKLASVLIVTDKVDEVLSLAARNLPFVAVCTTADITPVALMSHDNVLLTVDAVKKIEEWLA